MIRTRAACVLLLCSLLLLPPPPARAQQTTAAPATPRQAGAALASTSPKPDPNDPVERIKDEGLNRSQLMQTLSYITDVIGPRLTNSPQMKRANEWTRDTMTKWGLQNARLEAWGPFGRGWTLKRFSAEVVEPQGFPIVAYPKAWSPGTRGELVADVVHVDAKAEAELEKYKGRLAGKIVLVGPERKVEAHFKPLASRWTDEEMHRAATGQPFPPTNPAFAPPPSPEEQAASRFAPRRRQFVASEGAALIVEPSHAGDGGTVFVQSISIPYASDVPRERRARPWDRNAPETAPQVVAAAEHFNRVARMLRAGERVRMSVNLDVQFHEDDLMGYNTVAEIPGTDLREELVIMGAHLDSWHGGTGATDNAAGVAAMMEAARIIQTLGLKPRRTVRLALWGGEEQGALGSRAHVEKYFAKLGNGSGGVTPGPQYDKLSAYFNLDAGTGRIRGVFLHGNDALRPVLGPWLAPFRASGVTTLTSNSDWGSDFEWFEQAGIPVVNFIQDDIEYETRTHHSTQDTLERIQPDDLKQAATVIAAFVYQAAVRDERLPRKGQARR